MPISKLLLPCLYPNCYILYPTSDKSLKLLTVYLSPLINYPDVYEWSMDKIM